MLEAELVGVEDGGNPLRGEPGLHHTGQGVLHYPHHLRHVLCRNVLQSHREGGFFHWIIIPWKSLPLVFHLSSTCIKTGGNNLKLFFRFGTV